jgi:hypothetical protein
MYETTRAQDMLMVEPTTTSKSWEKISLTQKQYWWFLPSVGNMLNCVRTLTKKKTVTSFRTKQSCAERNM